ncbi:MAG: hypothetical protein IJE46_06350 [Clostridia bacterium]|nr:hypothetical protein [Clostridia bacterium]
MDAFLLGFAAWQRQNEMEKSIEAVEKAKFNNEISWDAAEKLESQIRINYGKGTWQDEFNVKFK